MFKSAKFIKAALLSAEFPSLLLPSGLPMPEIALVGRSNVGKSSLINHLMRNKNLAKTSSTPGKTQTINFFTIDERLALVDLPGYGFAHVDKGMRKKWSHVIEEYLNERRSLCALFLLLDIRRTPSEEDQVFVHQARNLHKPLTLLFTKTDLVKEREKKQNIAAALEILGNDHLYLPFSIKEANSRSALFHHLKELHGINC